MTLRHFEIFKTVAETCSFTKAAEKLYLTQSGVSHAIRELEEKTKTPLFDRLSKSVRLTKSGALLLEEIIPILSACQSLQSHISCLEKQAPIHLVSSITIASFWLPDILNHFHRLWPDLQVKVEVVSAAAAIRILCAGDADFALVEGVVQKGSYHAKVFDTYPMKFVCAPSYKLEADELEIEELCEQKLLLREKGSAIRDTLDNALYLKGHILYPDWTSVNSLSLIEAAKAGLGITVLPDVLLKDALELGELKVLTIKGLLLKNDLTLLTHREQSFTSPMRELMNLILTKNK